MARRHARARKALPLSASLSGEPFADSLDPGSQDTVLRSLPRQPPLFSSARRDARHLRVYRPRADADFAERTTSKQPDADDSTASQTRRSLLRRLFLEGTGSPGKAKTHPAIVRSEGYPASSARTPLSPQKRAALRRSSARLIRRVYLTDPLKCEYCASAGVSMASPCAIRIVFGSMSRTAR